MSGWKHRLDKQWGEQNPFWKGGKSTFTCRLCGKSFLAYQSEFDRGGARHCSRECAVKAKTKRRPMPCEWCGKEIERTTARSGHVFCSRACSGKWFSKNRSGINSPHRGRKITPEHAEALGRATRERWKNPEYRARYLGANNPAWRGGVTPINQKIRLSAESVAWRKAVFERDDFTCQSCGKRGGTLHPHHILAFADYPDKRFDVDNGVTLCVDCHRKTFGSGSWMPMNETNGGPAKRALVFPTGSEGNGTPYSSPGGF